MVDLQEIYIIPLNYIEALRDDISILLEYNHSYKRTFSQHYPLHHIIISRFDFRFNESRKLFKFLFFIFFNITNIIFLICLNNRSKLILKKYLFHR